MTMFSPPRIAGLGSRVRAVLEPFRGRRCYFEPLAGNHGDTLILMAARLILAEFELEYVDAPDAAELIVINGGGGLFVEPWCQGLAQWRGYATGYPETPIIVLPSSFAFADADFVSNFERRTAPTWLICREHGSVNRLEQLNLPDGVQVDVDHDLALHLAEHELVLSARGVPSAGYVLVVERFDSEQGTASRLLSSDAYRWAWKLPQPAQRLGKAMLTLARRRRSALRQQASSSASAFPALPNLPQKYEDVSNEHRYTFDYFVQTIAAADAIVTTRLHAGILAAMFGKPTFLKDGSSYRKLTSIYEYSMADWPHVHLLD